MKRRVIGLLFGTYLIFLFCGEIMSKAKIITMTWMPVYIFWQILILCNLPPSVLFIFNKIEIQNLHIVISSWKTVSLDLHKYMLLLFIVLNLNKLTKGGLCSGKAHSDSSTNFIYKLVLIIQPSVVHWFFFLWTSHVVPISVFLLFFCPQCPVKQTCIVD